MKTTYCNALLAALVLSVTSASFAQPKIPPKYKAEPLEIAQLPKYCWAQYVDGAYFGHPIYSIPASCGDYTNHFCSGLVVKMRASNLSKPKSQRREDLRMAKENFEYTLKYITPICPIYGDALAAKTQIEHMQRIIN